MISKLATDRHLPFLKSLLFILWSVVALSMGVIGCSGESSEQNGGEPVCGNGVIEGEQVCDGDELGGQTCEDLGLADGVLRCASNCLDFDVSGCGAPETCGDGEIDEQQGEVCDGQDLGGNTCEDFDRDGGQLACHDNCLDFDLSGCGPPISCGDGIIDADAGEVCDGQALGDTTCEDLGYDTGELACAEDCLAYDTTGCESDEDQCVPDCSGLECGPDPECGEECGPCDSLSTCDDGQCVPTCNFDEITGDMTVDIDLETVDVELTLTLNGETMPDAPDANRRGYIVLNPSDMPPSVPSWGSWYHIGTEGDATIQLEVYPDTYDIHYIPHLSAEVMPNIPHIYHTLAEDVEIDASTSLEYDLETTTVTGSLTIDGEPIPDNANDRHRGRLQFIGNFPATYAEDVLEEYDSEELYHTTPRHAYEVDLGSSGPVNLEVDLFDTEYDVVFIPPSSAREGLPEATTLVDSDVDVGGDPTIDFDLQMTTVSGDVTVDGSLPELEDGDMQYGSIFFTDRSTGAANRASLQKDETPNFEIELPEGAYDVSIWIGGSSYVGSSPLTRTEVATDVDLSGDPVLDYDIEPVTVSGEITLDGETMPDNTSNEEAERGMLRISDLSTGTRATVSLGASGPATYEFDLGPGTYQVRMEPGHQGSQDVLMSRKHKTLASNLEVSTDTTFDFDLETTTIDGEITVAGPSLFDDSPVPDQLWFADHESGEFYRTGDVTDIDENVGHFESEMYAGSYDVFLRGEPNRLDSLLVATDVETAGDPTLALDMETATVSGEITVNGETMPDNTVEDPGDRGTVRFREVVSGSEINAPIGPEGPATYSVELSQGVYDLEFIPDDDRDQDALPPVGPIEIKKGCVDAPTSCDGDVEDMTGDWSFSSIQRGENTRLSLEENDDALEGVSVWYFASHADPIRSGHRDGARATIAHEARFCRAQTDLRLRHGCLATGFMDIDCLNWTRRVVGRRLP